MAKNLNDILKNKENNDKKEALDNIKYKAKDEEEKLKEKQKISKKKMKKKFYKWSN